VVGRYDNYRWQLSVEEEKKQGLMVTWAAWAQRRTSSRREGGCRDLT